MKAKDFVEFWLGEMLIFQKAGKDRLFVENSIPRSFIFSEFCAKRSVGSLSPENLVQKRLVVSAKRTYLCRPLEKGCFRIRKSDE
jgi:hypothetical protein